jgi:hypothetical protein
VCVARMRTRCYLLFGSKLFTDCSLSADRSTSTVSDVKHLHDIALDSKQNAIDVWSAPIEQLPNFNR